MATLERAIQIAVHSHAGVPDKKGGPFVMHPLRVMLGVQGEQAQTVAVLHDVVEDTEVTLDDLREQGFSNQILEALSLMTHREDQSYADYVIGCRGNPLARQVKLSDLRDNASLDRVLLRKEKFAADTRRMQRYVLAYQFLCDQLSEAEYRTAMSGLEG